jgi:hypothetical protein
MCTQILEDNFLSHIVIDEALLHTYGYVNQHNCVIWSSKSATEHSKHKQNDPKVNMWHALTHNRVNGLFFFDEDIIKRNSFLNMLENYALLKPNNNDLILLLDGASVHFAYIVCDCLNMNFPSMIDRKRRAN